MEGKKIALVYDWLDKKGGAERLIKILLEIFPSADIYTSAWDKNVLPWLDEKKVKQGFVSSLPRFLSRRRKLLLPIYPFVFESFNFDQYDYVISLTAHFAKSVITKPSTKHLCYLLTPARALWELDQYSVSRVERALAGPVLSYLRKWDYLSSKRPDKYLFISQLVKRRAEKYYKASGEVLYPAFDREYWEKIALQSKKYSSKEKFPFLKKDYFLFVTRLEPYKRVDLFLEAAKSLKKYNFVLVGDGTLKAYVRKFDLPNLFYFSNLRDEELAVLYAKAKALVMPQVEEFGYTALESLFFSTPVVYFEKSGTAEIVGSYGISFPQQELKSLLRALEKCMKFSYNLRSKIEKDKKKIFSRFEKKQFRQKFISFLKGL